MTILFAAINWLALLQVAVVTIAATCVIAALMSLANWSFTPEEGLEAPVRSKQVFGWIMLGIIGCIIAFGIYLIVPYFH